MPDEITISTRAIAEFLLAFCPPMALGWIGGMLFMGAALSKAGFVMRYDPKMKRLRVLPVGLIRAVDAKAHAARAMADPKEK